MQRRIDVLEERVGTLESKQILHDQALFGFFDKAGRWNDGVVQHVEDIRNYAGIGIDLLRAFVKWALPPIWAGVGALILFLVRAAYHDWIAPHIHH